VPLVEQHRIAHLEEPVVEVQQLPVLQVLQVVRVVLDTHLQSLKLQLFMVVEVALVLGKMELLHQLVAALVAEVVEQIVKALKTAQRILDVAAELQEMPQTFQPPEMEQMALFS
jgi:hypothetical protein